MFGVLRKAPYDKVPYGRDARELQGKEGKYAEDLHAKKLDAEDPNDLEGKDAEDLHAKNLDAEDPNDLEGKDGVDLHAKNLDAKDPNDLEGKDSEELDAKKLDAQGVEAKPVDFIYHVTCLFTGASWTLQLVNVKSWKVRITHAHIYSTFWIILVYAHFQKNCQKKMDNACQASVPFFEDCEYSCMV